jgi:replicative DNA helicase
MKAELLDKAPPHSLDYERHVIGCMILQPACIDSVARVITADDFHGPANATLFRILVKMTHDGKAIDHALLMSEIRASKYESIIDVAYISALLEKVPIAKHAILYAGYVKQYAERRRIILAAEKSITSAFDESIEVEETIRTLNREIDDVQSLGYATSNGMMEGLELLDEDGRGNLHKIGYRAYDKNYGGIANGEMVVVAARPGDGKTAMAIRIVENICKTGVGLFASMEMTTGEIGLRRVAMESGIDGQLARQGKMSPEELKTLRETAAYLHPHQFHILARPDLTVDDIGRQARELKRTVGLDVIAIDYLQLLTPSNTKDRRHDQVSQMSRSIKKLALSLNVPILTLSQLNRDAANEEPRMKHLRETGAIEQDADVVMLLWRQNPNNEPHKAEMKIDKHRHGQVKKLSINWNPDIGMYEDLKVEAHDEFYEFG